MDKGFFYQKRSEGHQHEISKELETRNLLNDRKREPLTAEQAQRLVLRIAPVAIVVTILILIALFG